MQDTESIYVHSAAELAARLACVHRPVAAMFDMDSGNGGDAFELRLSAEQFASLVAGVDTQNDGWEVRFVRVENVAYYGPFSEPGDKTKLGPQE